MIRLTTSWRRLGVSFLALALAGGALAGCGDVPRPFARPSDDLAAHLNPLVALRSGTGVSLSLAEGVPVPWNRLLALEAAEALRTQGIPADVSDADGLGGGQGRGLGHRLILTVLPPGDGPAALPGLSVIPLRWRLLDDNDQPVTQGQETIRLARARWESAAPEAAQTVTAPAVAAVSAALGVDPRLGNSDDAPPWHRALRRRATVETTQAASAASAATATPLPAASPMESAPPQAAPTQAVARDDVAPPAAARPLQDLPAPADAPPPVKPAAAPGAAAPASAARPDPAQGKREETRQAEAARVTALRPLITEAPGDGVTALSEALATLIRSAGVSLTDDPKRATFGLKGTITTQAVAGGKDKVVLVWEVLDPRSGTVLGTVRQENFVPSGLLAKPWGRLAYDIAQGALEGVGAVLAKQAPKP